MPDTKQTMTITLTPYTYADAEDHVREWFNDQDEYLWFAIDKVTIISQQWEKYIPSIRALEFGEGETHLVEENKGSFMTNQIWEDEFLGSLDGCMEFIRTCPGLGVKCRIRPVPTHEITYEHAQNGMIVAEIEYHKV